MATSRSGSRFIAPISHPPSRLDSRNSVYLAVRGLRPTIIDGSGLLDAGDMFVIPSWATHDHPSTTRPRPGAPVLFFFSVHDTPCCEGRGQYLPPASRNDSPDGASAYRRVHAGLAAVPRFDTQRKWERAMNRLSLEHTEFEVAHLLVAGSRLGRTPGGERQADRRVLVVVVRRRLPTCGVRSSVAREVAA